MKLSNLFIFLTLIFILPLQLWGEEKSILCSDIIQGELTLIQKIQKISHLDYNMDLRCLEGLKLSAIKNLGTHFKSTPSTSSFQMNSDEILSRIQNAMEVKFSKKEEVELLDPPQSLINYAQENGFGKFLKKPMPYITKNQFVNPLPQNIIEDIQTVYFHSSIQSEDYLNSPLKDIGRLINSKDLKNPQRTNEKPYIFDLHQLISEDDIQQSASSRYIFCDPDLYVKHSDIQEEIKTLQEKLARWVKQNQYIGFFYLTALNLSQSIKGHTSINRSLDINKINYYQIVDFPKFLFDSIDPELVKNISLFLGQIKYITFLRSFLYGSGSCYPYAFEEQLSLYRSPSFSHATPSQEKTNNINTNNNLQEEKNFSVSVKYELFTTPLFSLHNIYQQLHTTFDTSETQALEAEHHSLNKKYNQNAIKIFFLPEETHFIRE